MYYQLTSKTYCYYLSQIMKWDSFVDVIQKISAGTSIFLNLVLTFLIIKKSPKQLGSYKYLMIYISWFEILYSIIDVVISPIMFSDSSLVVVMIHKTAFLNRKSYWISLILVAIYCACFGTSMGMFGIHFIYRYLVSNGSNYLKTFDDYRIIFWMLFPVASGSIWGSICYFMLAPSDAMNQRLSKKVMLTFGWEIEDVAYLGPYFYQIQPDGSYIIDISSVLGVGIAWLFLFSSLIAIFYCGIRCYLNLTQVMNIKTNDKNVSKNFKNLQAQLFNALVTQTAIPVILMHIPLSIVILFSYIDKDLGTLSGISSITIALFPALDPLPSMFIIQNYRKTIFGLFKITKVISINKK
ncbi:unnamed protein product [Caenorhabditis angaria]|uniref:Serpentine receptor class r-10 n=1 Tax=Caenorhabditis angaria TaxID=860376 RepID=A0A9P1IPH0_9PELO|nr:unnamed protein product [Caenorhabditis angaria]